MIPGREGEEKRQAVGFGSVVTIREKRREPLREEEIVKILDSEDSEFQQLEREHRELEEKLTEINSRVYLSGEEEMEKKKIQKLKLLKKDRMAEMVRQYRKAHLNN
jgi:uncharacterized protein YdcH (DUF465 family)